MTKKKQKKIKMFGYLCYVNGTLITISGNEIAPLGLVKPPQGTSTAVVFKKFKMIEI